jgi:hypothetical protein
MRKLNVTAIKAAINGAFKAADTYATYVAELQALFADSDRETIKDHVCPLAAKKYGAEYKDGQWTEPTCAAKRYANRLIAAIMGTTSDSAEPPTVAAPAKLTKSIVNQIIGAGLTHAEFTALLAAVRNGISFK